MSLGRRWRDRVFWGAHSITWDSGAPDEVHTRRALDIAARLSSLGVPGGGRVLDLGCATGELSVALGKAGFEVVGVDVSRAMLRQARRKGRGLSRIPTFQPADLNEPLPFQDGSFNSVLCANALQCVERPVLLLQEARRVLVHGGWLVVIGKVPGSRACAPPLSALGARLFAPIKRWASRWAQPLPEAVLLESVKTVGFVDVTARSMDDRAELSGRAS